MVNSDRLSECAELNQTGQNLQLIIVDDGSTDHSRKIVEKFSDSRIEIYRLERQMKFM